MHAFCDALSVSLPAEHRQELLTALRPSLEAAGLSPEVLSGAVDLYRQGEGIVRGQVRGQVYVLYGSGGALERLRAVGYYGEYLHAIAALPHRVTSLHATLDQVLDAPPRVHQVYRRAKRGLVAFTSAHWAAGLRKPELYWGPGADGRDTGTCYVGSRQAEVRGVVYDKRHERISKGFPDPGPLYRIEMRVKSQMGATLRDAWEPTCLFYHLASPALIAAPPNIQHWEPGAMGFDLPRRVPLLPAERMATLLDSSADVRRLLELADQCGPHGRELLCSRLMAMTTDQESFRVRGAAA